MSTQYMDFMNAVVATEGDAAVRRPSRGSAMNFVQQCNTQRARERKMNREVHRSPVTPWDGWVFSFRPADDNSTADPDGPWVVFARSSVETLGLFSQSTGKPYVEEDLG